MGEGRHRLDLGGRADHMHVRRNPRFLSDSAF
jgi:hypothetical protein